MGRGQRPQPARQRRDPFRHGARDRHGSHACAV